MRVIHYPYILLGLPVFFPVGGCNHKADHGPPDGIENLLLPAPFFGGKGKIPFYRKIFYPEVFQKLKELALAVTHGAGGDMAVGDQPMQWPPPFEVKTEPDGCGGKKGEKAGFGAYLRHDDHVEALAAQPAEKRNPVFRPAFAVKRDKPVDSRLMLDQFIRECLQHPGQVGIRIAVAQTVDKAKGMHRIADS